MKKTAVILFNLGGPDSRETIRPFLFNFFMDKNIIRLPWPLRFFIAWMISSRRSRKEAGESYSLLGNKSPLLENTQEQALALQKELGPDYKIFVCMRYWHPMADEVAAQVKDYDPEKIILLPLYPQYSTTTTRSSFQDWYRACKELRLDKATREICCYPVDKSFIESSVEKIKSVYQDALQKSTAKNLAPPRILFSAHGLPEDIINDGDPYQWQCEQGAEAIAQALEIENLDWQICYQSRVGPKKWIGPSTEEALRKAAEDQVPVIIYPHAFVSEHVETLVEIEIEYREFAQDLGVPYFVRVPTVSTNEIFIRGLADLISSPAHEKICPQTCKACGHKA